LKLRLLTLCVALVAALGITATAAVAGNGATTAQFKASYDDSSGPHFECSGARIVKAAPKAFTKDSETCVISGDLSNWPVGTYENVGGWVSDYDYFVNGIFNLSLSNTFVVTDNGDGTRTIQIEAYFN